MPTYNFRNKETGEITEEFLRMSELDQYKQDNPHLEQAHVSAPALSYAGATTKPSDGFRDVLKRIKKNNQGSNINTF